MGGFYAAGLGVLCYGNGRGGSTAGLAEFRDPDGSWNKTAAVACERDIDRGMHWKDAVRKHGGTFLYDYVPPIR